VKPAEDGPTNKVNIAEAPAEMLVAFRNNSAGSSRNKIASVVGSADTERSGSAEQQHK